MCQGVVRLVVVRLVVVRLAVARRGGAPLRRATARAPSEPGPSAGWRSATQLILSIAAVFFSSHSPVSGAEPAASAEASWPSALLT